jgi:hypothetical protein
MSQVVDTTTQMIQTTDTTVPMVLRVVQPRKPGEMMGGAAASSNVVSEYVLLSALPQELKERVITAIKAQMG